MKKVLALLMIALMVVSVSACNSKNQEPTAPTIPVPNSLLDSVDTQAPETVAAEKTQTITCQELSMTLPDDFIDQSSLSPDEAIIGVYTSPEGALGVSIVREDKERFSSEYTANQYLSLQRANANSKAKSISEIQEKNGRKYFDYSATNNNLTFKYFSTTYVSSKAYWMVPCFCFADDYDEYFDTFLEWTDSVKFSS